MLREGDMRHFYLLVFKLVYLSLSFILVLLYSYVTACSAPCHCQTPSASQLCTKGIFFWHSGGSGGGQFFFPLTLFYTHVYVVHAIYREGALA